MIVAILGKRKGICYKFEVICVTPSENTGESGVIALNEG
jgi:hypothetical protein